MYDLNGREVTRQLVFTYGAQDVETATAKIPV